MKIEPFLQVCSYCEQPNTVERWDGSSYICTDCGKCCEKRCLPFQLDNSSYEMEYHDRALELMDQSYKAIVKDINPYGYPSRVIKKLIWNDSVRQVADTVMIMIEMIVWRKAIWYKGKWESLC